MEARLEGGPGPSVPRLRPRVVSRGVAMLPLTPGAPCTHRFSSEPVEALPPLVSVVTGEEVLLSLPSRAQHRLSQDQDLWPGRG